MSKTRKITQGTREWASSNVNLYSGCSNNCPYCYAKKMAIRFGRKTEENWSEMELNIDAVTKGYRKRQGRIMFPTSHDITSESLYYSIIVLRKLLEVGNTVLITTKPNLWCVYNILNQLEQYKTQIQFRFTITSISDYHLRFWEPNATNFEERLQSLILAYKKGFKTSISIEPFLDKDPIPLILKLNPFVSETIWLGKMNYIKATNITSEEKQFYEYQRKICSWTNIKKILLEIQKLPDDIKSKIRLKDSLRNMGFSMEKKFKDRKCDKNLRNHKKYHTLSAECDITPKRCFDAGDKDLKGRSNPTSPSRQTSNKEDEIN